MIRFALALWLFLIPTLAWAGPAKDGRITTSGDTVRIDVTDMGNGTIQITGTWTGTIVFEATLDGTVWASLSVTPIASTTDVSSATANGIWTYTGAFRAVRVRASTAITGTAVISLIATQARAGGGKSAGVPAGVVTGSGTTPQVAVWDSSSTITGFSGLTFTAPTLTVSGADNALLVSGSTTGNPVSITPMGDADLMFRLIPRGNAPVNISPNADTDGNVSYLEVADFNMSGTRDRAINADLFTNSNAHIVGVGGALAISANIGGGSGITVANAGLQGLNADVYYYGSGLADELTGVKSIVDTGGLIDNAHGVWVRPVSHGSTTNTFYGYRLSVPLVVGGGPTTYTTVYGIKLEDVNWGVTNYAIYTGAGSVRIGQRTGTAATMAAFTSAGVLTETTLPTGTVSSIATTSPITGGTITTTGTIACATCVTSAAALTANQLVIGAGSQATAALGSLGTTTTVLHGNAAGAPTFGAVANADLVNSATTVNGQTCTLGSSCTVTAVPSGSAGGDLSGTYPNPTVAKVNAVAYPASPSTNTVPVVTGSNTVTYEAVPNAALANSSITVTGTSPVTSSGSPVSLGGTVTVACPTCNASASNPYVVPSSVAAKGGIVGGTASGANASPMPLFTGSSANPSTQSIPVASWVRGLYVNTASTQTAGAWQTWRLRINGNTVSNMGEVGIIGGQVAGVYSEAVLARVLPLSSLDLIGATQAGSSNNMTGWSSELLLDDGGLLVGAWNNANIAAPGTSYVSVYSATGAGGLQTTVGAGSWVSPIAATAQNLCVKMSTAQDASGTFVATLYVNGSSTSVTVTQAAGGAAGIFCDQSHTASITANQTVSLELKNNGTAGTTTVQAWTLEILPTSGTPGVLGGGVIGAVASGSTNYYRPFTGTTNATEANVRVPMPRAGTMTNLCVQRNVAASVGTTTATVFKNGSATGQLTFTIGNATGPQCTTGSVAIAAGDTITLEIKNSVACTGGCPTLGGWSADY